MDEETEKFKKNQRRLMKAGEIGIANEPDGKSF
jgi:hypothetical protein